MAFGFCSFSSGSSGNCYLIKHNNTALLVDAGISCKRIFTGLEKTDTDIENVEAVFITHEHTDHVKALPVLAKKVPEVPIFANEKTWQRIGCAAEVKKSVMEPGDTLLFGGVKVQAYSISHDSVSAQAYSFEADGKKIALLTDTGCVTDEIYEHISDADLLVLEANYEKEVLLLCRYPYRIKQRILSKRGHLSNIDAAETIARIMKDGRGGEHKRIVLAHLSKENNMPELAYQTVVNRLEEEGIYVGSTLSLSILLRDTLSNFYFV